MLMQDMPSVEGWLQVEEILQEQGHEMMSQHGSRNPELQDYPEWITKIDRLQREAHKEWLEAWKKTYSKLLEFVAEDAYSKVYVVTDDEGLWYACPACEQIGRAHV